MRPRSRILRILLALLLVLAFAGFFAFSTFLFSPLEGDYRADVSTLVPRDVDFFLAKADLAGDVPEFPRPALLERLERTHAWRTLLSSPEFQELARANDLDAGLAELRALPEQLRGIEPLKVFGGKDLAIAGYFRGPDLASADWAVYGRANWLGKLGAALLFHPGLLPLEEQGLTAAVSEDHVALAGPALAREVFVTRVRDVVVAGTSLDLVRKARELEERAGQDSFGQRATYFDQIQNAPRGIERDEIELFVDWRTWSEKARIGGRWPDPQSQDLGPAFLGRLFQMGSVKSLAGVVGFQQGVQVRLHGELSSELMTPLQNRLYRARGADRGWILANSARVAKEDSALFLHVEAPVGDLLRQLLEAGGPHLRGNVEDLLRSTGQFTDLEQALSEIDKLFKSRLAVVLREDDLGRDPEKDPPSDGRPVPLVALVLWTDGSARARERIDELHRLVVSNQQRIGLQGRNPGDHGVFKNRVAGGFDVWEFWSQLVPGTGHVSTAQDRDLYVVSNSFRMVGDVLNVNAQGGSRFPRLSERPDFAGMLHQGLAEANLVSWIAPRRLSGILRRTAQQRAEDSVLGAVDWELERAREERRVIAERFPNEVPGRLSAEVQSQVDAIVNPRLESLEQRKRIEEVPLVVEAFERELAYLELASGALAMLALDPKHFDLVVDGIVPLEPLEP